MARTQSWRGASEQFVFLILFVEWLPQARKARALWKAWLQIKASFQDPREVSEQGVHVRTNYSLTMTKTIHLALALVLIEPCSFAIASAQLLSLIHI